MSNNLVGNNIESNDLNDSFILIESSNKGEILDKLALAPNEGVAKIYENSSLDSMVIESYMPLVIGDESNRTLKATHKDKHESEINDLIDSFCEGKIEIGFVEKIIDKGIEQLIANRSTVIPAIQASMSIKKSFCTVLATVCTALYNSSFFATMIGFTAGGLVVDLILKNKDYKYTRSALGVVSATYSLPIVAKLLAASIAGSAIFLTGASSMQNHILLSAVSFLGSAPGYLATLGGMHTISLIMNSYTFKEYLGLYVILPAKEIIRQNINTAIGIDDTKQVACYDVITKAANKVKNVAAINVNCLINKGLEQLFEVVTHSLPLNTQSNIAAALPFYGDNYISHFKVIFVDLPLNGLIALNNWANRQNDCDASTLHLCK